MKRGVTLPENQNVKMSRKLLYNEVWEISVAGVAKKYNVPYAELLKFCKEAEIPIPPSGYWTKLSYGKPVIKTPLPDSSLNEITLPTNKTCKIPKHTVIVPTVNTNVDNDQAKIKGTVTKTSSQLLLFLPENERNKVLAAAQQIQMSPDNLHLHKKIIAYKSVIKEWNENDVKPEGAPRSLSNFYNRPPFLAGVISKETLPRVFHILNVLFQQLEHLGGSVNDDLSLNIRNENVHIEVVEAQDEIKHEITREEAKELLIYEDAIKHNSWASKPKIRKYDYVFNGRLRITIHKNRHFKDIDNINIESMLGEMLIELYEESEVVRINREAKEEEQRKREEERRAREEHRILYNAEVERTIGLVNTSQDYDIACKIRAYITALESSKNIDDKTKAIIDWANKKADWFDPTVDRNDELLGKREHEKSEDEKALKKSGSYWW